MLAAVKGIIQGKEATKLNNRGSLRCVQLLLWRFEMSQRDRPLVIYALA